MEKQKTITVKLAAKIMTMVGEMPQVTPESMGEFVSNMQFRPVEPGTEVTCDIVRVMDIGPIKLITARVVVSGEEQVLTWAPTVDSFKLVTGVDFDSMEQPESINIETDEVYAHQPPDVSVFNPVNPNLEMPKVGISKVAVGIMMVIAAGIGFAISVAHVL